MVARNQCLSWTFLGGRSLQQHVVSSKHCAWAGAEPWPRDALQTVSEKTVRTGETFQNYCYSQFESYCTFSYLFVVMRIRWTSAFALRAVTDSTTLMFCCPGVGLPLVSLLRSTRVTSLHSFLYIVCINAVFLPRH